MYLDTSTVSFLTLSFSGGWWWRPFERGRFLDHDFRDGYCSLRGGCWCTRLDAFTRRRCRWRRRRRFMIMFIVRVETGTFFGRRCSAGTRLSEGNLSCTLDSSENALSLRSSDVATAATVVCNSVVFYGAVCRRRRRRRR